MALGEEIFTTCNVTLGCGSGSAMWHAIIKLGTIRQEEKQRKTKDKTHKFLRK